MDQGPLSALSDPSILARAGQKKLSSLVGFSLIEVMLALAFSMLTLSFLLQIYLANRHSLDLQMALAQIEVHTQRAYAILKNDIQQAGYIGCLPLHHTTADLSYPPYVLNAANYLSSKDGASIHIQHAGKPAYLIKYIHRSKTLVITNNMHFSPKDLMIIADCKQAELFKIAEINYADDKQIIRLKQGLKNTYRKEAQIARLESNNYFVQKTKRSHLDGSAIYALMMQTFNHPASELIEDIREIRVFFAIKNNGLLLELPAQKVKDAEKISAVSLKFSLEASAFKKTGYLYAALRNKI